MPMYLMKVIRTERYQATVFISAKHDHDAKQTAMKIAARRAVGEAFEWPSPNVTYGAKITKKIEAISTKDWLKAKRRRAKA